MLQHLMIFEHSEMLIMQPKTDICENAALNGIGERHMRPSKQQSRAGKGGRANGHMSCISVTK